MKKGQLDILNEIRVKMFYDTSKTLRENFETQIKEQNLLGGDTRIEEPGIDPDPLKTAMEEAKPFPIAGYITYWRPSYTSPGYAVGYFPVSTTNIKKFLPFGVTCEDFGNGKWCPWNSETEEDKRGVYNINEKLEALLPAGTIKQFTWNGKTYVAAVERDGGTMKFVGYTESGSGLQKWYNEPNPDDYKTSFEKFLDEWQMTYQIIASIVVIVAIEYFTAGLGTPLAWRLALEILGEVLVNLPVAMYEYKKGNTAQSGLEMLFALLPLINSSSIKALGVPKEVLERGGDIAQKMSKTSIKNSQDLVDFYKTLDGPEQYLFSRVMRQNPEVLAKDAAESLKVILKTGAKNPDIMKPILFKHKLWWRQLGAQGVAAFAITVFKSLLFTDFSEDEIQRMNVFMMDMTDEMNEFELELVQDALLNADTVTLQKVADAMLHPQDKDSIAFLNEFFGALDIPSQQIDAYNQEDLSNSPK